MQPFVAALGTELGLTSKDIADIIWLALQMQNSDAGTELPTMLEASPPEPEGEARSRPVSPDFVPPVKPEKKPELEAQPKSAELHQPNANQPSFGRQLALKVPDARSLREPLSLARSLKPLLRRVVSGWSTTLDEAATVERIADEQLWLPVLKPALEPWLDLALLVDESISMQIWHRTIAELQRLLSHYGVFRDVRVWRLVTDDLGQVKLQPGIGTTARRQTARRPSELIDPSGRRLILVATDCVSSVWQDGTLVPALKLWASSGPLAIVQMLPEWLWSRTGLGFASAVKLQSLLPGVPNQQLIASEVSPWDEIDLDAGIKVPVVTLEPEPFATWTEMVAGKGGVWSPGFVLEEAVSPNGQISQLSAIATEGSAEQRVQRFRVTASPMARRLAGLLAAAPVISLPIVRIIQDRLLAKSQQVHVAEVFLGGLLKPLGEIETKTNPDLVQYDFWDGVRKVLLASVPTIDSVNVLEEVSKFVAERLGLSLDAFTAVLRNPQRIENRDLANQSHLFAMVTVQILRQLGGEYARFAEDLEQHHAELKQALANTWKGDSNEETERLYEARLFIVGEGGSGKTTLARKILDSTYPLQPDEESTQGIDITQWCFTLGNGREMRVNIWEFGGQEIYHATNQFFLTKRSLYVLVVDTRREDTDFYYWLSIIGLMSDNSPIIIVKNEKQDRQCQLNEHQLRSEFINLKEILATNLVTNRGFPEILISIQRHIQSLPHIGVELPKTWAKIREILERKSHDYISVNEYLQICQDNGSIKQEDALQLSGYLHDLGVCLHFQEDDFLNKILILKPTWVTNAIHQVLNDIRVIQKSGKFDRNDLAAIWHEDRYAKLRPELLRLMMKFNLCYEIPRSPGTYIAPQLLSLNQPEYLWDKSDNLLLRYEYEFMPKGILTRFIVEMHQWIEQQTYVWKTGVVLSKDDARAEVIELYRYHKGELRIRISGEQKRNLLTTIRHELDKIHATYERLNYRTLVPCSCQTCKNSQTPYFYALERLYNLSDAGRLRIQCYESGDDVEVQSLIDSIVSDQPLLIDLQRQRLERQRKHLQSEWDLSNEKLVQLHQELASTINISDKSQLEEQIKVEERQLVQLQDELNAIEQEVIYSKISIELPQGQVDLNSQFYVERSPIEEHCYEEVTKPGALIRIKAPHQMGKTSLLSRTLNYAAQQGCVVVALSFQQADSKVFSNMAQFLRWFCLSVGRKLRLPNKLADYWDDDIGSLTSCSIYFEEYLLVEIPSSLVLGLDEVDLVLQRPEIAADFLALLRSWHEQARMSWERQWTKLRLVIVHSTEANIPMGINQSPFNVGASIELPAFTANQILDLAQRHGLNWNFEQVNKLMSMVGGYPYLVRCALYQIAQQNLNLDDLLKLAPTETGPYGDHLRRHFWNLQQHPELKEAMQLIAKSTQPVALNYKQAWQLDSMGLIKLTGNRATVSCELYRRYFQEHLGST